MPCAAHTLRANQISGQALDAGCSDPQSHTTHSVLKCRKIEIAYGRTHGSRTEVFPSTLWAEHRWRPDTPGRCRSCPDSRGLAAGPVVCGDSIEPSRGHEGSKACTGLPSGVYGLPLWVQALGVPGAGSEFELGPNLLSLDFLEGFVCRD